MAGYTAVREVGYQLVMYSTLFDSISFLLNRYFALPMKFTGADVAEIIFKEPSKTKLLHGIPGFIRDETCVMKVVGLTLSQMSLILHSTMVKALIAMGLTNPEINLFACESTAYKRLTQAGVCSWGTLSSMEQLSILIPSSSVCQRQYSSWSIS